MSDEWKIITSAPKDGSKIKIRGDKTEKPIVVFWDNQRKGWQMYLPEIHLKAYLEYDLKDQGGIQWSHVS